jgi:zinc/manganese transport system substrate-binding protein
VARHSSASSGRFRRLLALGVVLAAGLLTACGSGTRGGSAGDPSVRVVAAENSWGDIAKQLGGRHVHVTSIVNDPSADPHLYESTAQNAVAVAGADLVIENGLGYDDFIGRLIGASHSSRRHVLTVRDVLQVGGEDANPHLWYDTPRVPQVAQAIATALIAEDPAEKAVFLANLRRFDAALTPVLQALQTIRTKYPQAPVAYTERVPGYQLADAGLQVRTPPGFAQAIEDGNEPSPADRAAMEQLMTGHQVRVLLDNTQATSPVTEHIRDLARRSNIPVVEVTETLPSGDATFQAWQLRQLTALLDGLGG